MVAFFVRKIRIIRSVLSEYGEGTFDFYDNDITVTVPFNFIHEVGNKVGNKTGNKVGIKVGNKVCNKTEENGLNDSRTKALAEIRNNPNITKKRTCGRLLFRQNVNRQCRIRFKKEDTSKELVQISPAIGNASWQKRKTL